MDNNNLVFFMFRRVGPAMFRNTQVAMPCVAGCGCLLHQRSYFHGPTTNPIIFLAHLANSQILDLHVFPKDPDVYVK
ncbi:hypothetical protein ACE6H2_012630 [Prunus campanulata]